MGGGDKVVLCHIRLCPPLPVTLLQSQIFAFSGRIAKKKKISEQNAPSSLFLTGLRACLAIFSLNNCMSFTSCIQRHEN